MLLNHSKFPLEGYPHPRWGVQGIQYTVYSIQYTLPWGPVPPQGGCTYTIYSVEYTSPWVPSPAEEYAVYSIQYIRQGGEYAVYSTLPHWGLYLSWTSAVNTAAAARFLYSVNFSISVGPPRIRMGPDCGAIARFCFVVVHLRLVYTLCSVSPSV